MDPLTLYFIFQADGIKGLLIAGAIVSGIAIFVLVIAQLASMDAPVSKFPDGAIRFRKRLVMAFIPLALLATFIPSTSTLIKIYSIDAVITAASDNEELSKLPDNVLKYINTFLEEELNDMRNSETTGNAE